MAPYSFGRLFDDVTMRPGDYARALVAVYGVQYAWRIARAGNVLFDGARMEGGRGEAFFNLERLGYLGLGTLFFFNQVDPDGDSGIGDRMMYYLPAGFRATWQSTDWWRKVAWSLFALWLIDKAQREKDGHPWLFPMRKRFRYAPSN
jgi:hypothetical protein